MRKRTITIISALLLLSLLLAGCGEKADSSAGSASSVSQPKTDEMAAEIVVVETAIDNIGKITPESEAKIELAEELYSQLSVEAREQVGNAKTLTDARDEFEKMEKDINTVIDLIDAIGEVNLSKGSVIEQARKSYVALMYDEKEYVDNYDVLLAAEEAYDALARQDAYDTFLAEFEGEKATEALETAEEFLNSKYGPDFADQVNELCCGAYVKIAKYNYSNGYYQTALYYIDQCKELYAETETVSQIYDVEKSVWKTLADIEPENGEIVEDTLGSGYGEFALDNTEADYNSLVKLVSVSDENKYRCFYVRSGEKATINVPDGEYEVRFAEGKTWYGQKAMFGNDMLCSIIEKTYTYKTNYHDDGTCTYQINTIFSDTTNQWDPIESVKIDPEDF